MVDVFRAPVISRNGLAGMKLISMLGKVTAFAVACDPCKTNPCATSAALAVSPTAVKPYNFAISMPIAAATIVVAIRMPIVSTLILPIDRASLSLRIAAMIDTMIKGITIICSNFT